MRPTPAPHRLQRKLLKRRLQAVRVGEEVAGVAGEQAGGVVVCRQAAGMGRHRDGTLSGASSQAAVAGWQQSCIPRRGEQGRWQLGMQHGGGRSLRMQARRQRAPLQHTTQPRQLPCSLNGAKGLQHTMPSRSERR